MALSNKSTESAPVPFIPKNAPAFYSGKTKNMKQFLNGNENKYRATYRNWEHKNNCTRPPRVTHSQQPTKSRYATIPYPGSNITVTPYPESLITVMCNYRYDPYNVNESKVYLEIPAEDSTVVRNMCDYPYW